MMVVGWDPTALVPPINAAIAADIPVVCVDADVPASKRLSFIGTDWFDLGVRQAEAMVKALAGRTGQVALLGLIEQEDRSEGVRGIPHRRGEGRSHVLEPQQDKGNRRSHARRRGDHSRHRDLVGMAGFDSESGPGMARPSRKPARPVRSSPRASKPKNRTCGY